METNILQSLSRRKNGKSGAGFTLVEILLVMFMSGLLLTAFFTLFDWHGKVYNYQQAVVRVSGSSRASVQAVDFYGRQASHILESWDFDGVTVSSSPTAIVLQLPAVDRNGEVLAGKWDYAAFFADGPKLYQLVGADSLSSRVSGKKQLSDTLNSLEFTYDNADFTQAKEVSVDLQTTLQARNQTVSSRLLQHIYLKNY